MLSSTVLLVVVTAAVTIQVHSSGPLSRHSLENRLTTLEATVNQLGCNLRWQNKFKALQTKIKKMDTRFQKIQKYLQEKVRNSVMKDNEGIVVNKKQIAFHASLQSSVTLSGVMNVIFGSVITNTGGAYNPKNGYFKAPSNGLYFFACTFLKQSTPYLRLQMVKNNKEVIAQGHAEDSNADAGSMVATVFLNQHETVSIRHHPSFGHERIHGDWSFFTGYMLN